MQRIDGTGETTGATGELPTVILALATGKIARKTDRPGLRSHFDEEGWILFDDDWLRQQLRDRSTTAYENDVAHVCSKILLRGAGPHWRGAIRYLVGTMRQSLESLTSAYSWV